MNKDDTKPWRVDMIESERGWGSKVDESFYFDTFEEADKFHVDYNNKHNTAWPPPDWYIVAEEPVRNKVSNR
jgi:hypothetical protein